MATRTRWGAIALSLALLVAGCSNDDDDEAATAAGGTPVEVEAEEPSAPAFVEGDCPSPIPRAEGFRCGTVTVPMRRGDPGSPAVDLAVAVLPAPEPRQHEDPVVVVHDLEPTIAGYDGHAALPERVERDVVVFDIRGIGHSTPSLECTEIGYLTPISDTQEGGRQEYLDEIEKCRERLEGDGIDLSAYTTDAIAADVVDIRRALGYERWNVIGYGNNNYDDPGIASTEIVYELMRTDQGAIRSVTIEAPTPAQADPWTTQIENLARAIDEVTSACQVQTACAPAPPDFRASLAGNLQRPRTEHQLTSAAGDPVTVVMDTASVSHYTARGLAAPDYLPLVPALMDLPAEEVAEVIAATTGPEAMTVHGLLLSVLCRQVGAATSLEDRTPDTDIGLLMWGTIAQADSCSRWPAADPDGSKDEPVSSDIPTLLLVGQFDPIATMAGARLVASTLANAHVYEIPAATANPLGHSECAREIRNSFVQDPESEPDTSCVASVPPLQFSS